MRRKVFGLLTLLLTLSSLQAQVNVFASAKLDRTSVYPQQPIKASITIYTETWFTKPLDIESIQVPNAFVLPFKGTLSSMREVNGKKYASLEFFYLIYPYQPGSYALPEISVGVESPPAGDYKGVLTNVKTKSLPFEVKDRPSEFNGEEWFVAKDVQITEKWNRPLNRLKVGDVVERSIVINAKGTLPNFIPDIAIEDEEFATIYKQSPRLEDNRTSQSANGRKIETYLYLLTETGEFMIPELSIEWWNPYATRVYRKIIPERTITIKENPDLGILKTRQDSLRTVSSQEIMLSTSKFSWWETYGSVFLLIGFVLLLSILLFTGSKKFYVYYRSRMHHHRQSEPYLFEQMKNKQGAAFNLAVHKWWSIMYLHNGLSPSLAHECKKRHLPEKPLYDDLILLRKEIMTSASKNNKLFSSLQTITAK
mgnify:FL=1